MKNLPLLGLILPLICAYISVTTAQSHNVTWGMVGPNDTLLEREIVTKKYKFLRIIDEEFAYPRENFSNDYIITAVRVTDLYTDGDGGYAMLTSGGPGVKYVTINLKSQRTHGFNFIIEVFGREDK